MKIRLEWKWETVAIESHDREYVTLDAKDIRRLCRDVAVKGEPYLVEVFHSDPLVPPTQSVRMIDGTIHHHEWSRRHDTATGGYTCLGCGETKTEEEYLNG